MKRFLTIGLSFFIASVALFVLWPQQTQAQSSYTIDEFDPWIASSFYTNTAPALIYSDTTQTGQTSLTLSEIQTSIGTADSIASDGVTIEMIAPLYIGTGDFWIQVNYTNTATSFFYYPTYVAGVDSVFVTLPDGNYLDSIDLFVEIAPASSEYGFISIEVIVPASSVGSTPAASPTPTPWPIPTIDALTYTWGAVPTPIAIPTAQFTDSLTTTVFWDISNYEYSFSVARTVWQLDYMQEAVQIAVYSGAVMLGLYVLLRIIGAQLQARTVATTVINSGQDQNDINQQELNQRALEARNEFLQEERNRLLKDLGRISQDRIRSGRNSANRRSRR